ncbi:MAG: 2,3,4,5-tetrahydropyridine-2,6-dicarboxylate N-succinyltransferase [Pseudomonadota bacterium]
MSHAQLETIINAAWERRTELSPATKGEVAEAVSESIRLLDSGTLRVATKEADGWVTHQWLKKAVLLSFRLNDNVLISGGPAGSAWWDKVPSKFEGWGAEEFSKAGFRAVPNCTVRRGAYIAPNAILMVGSCAQIGKNVHLSGGVGIGGVLEPVQAGPTIIEDNCFIGARSEVVEGVVVGEGSVISMGVFIGQSTKVIDRETGEVFMGRVPPYSVVVSGSMPGKPLPDGTMGPSLYCAVIVKRVDAKTRAKTGINELLRD